MADIDIAQISELLKDFGGNALTSTLSRVEQSAEGLTVEECETFLSSSSATADVLEAAGVIKNFAGQINVVIHALGILRCLPHLLEDGEVVEYVSLGAGNTGREFDLETNYRVAEFKFIKWRGGPESIRQNSIFKDFFLLAESESQKSKYLYVLGAEHPLKFLNGGRALSSVLSKDNRIRERFTLAHEFGHYVLHRCPLQAADYADEVLADGFDFACLPLQANEWKDVEKEREEEADTFASYLLMPIDDYREQVAGEDMTLNLLNHVRKRYGVSLLAAVRKWIEFTETRAAMVVARDGFALWGRASTAAYKTGVFIRSGMPIPRGSIAALGPAAQGAEANQAIALPADVWTFSRGSEPVRELTTFSERLGISVSLLQFEKDAHVAVIDDDEPWDMYDQFSAGGQS